MSVQGDQDQAQDLVVRLSLKLGEVWQGGTFNDELRKVLEKMEVTTNEQQLHFWKSAGVMTISVFGNGEPSKFKQNVMGAVDIFVTAHPGLTYTRGDVEVEPHALSS